MALTLVPISSGFMPASVDPVVDLGAGSKLGPRALSVSGALAGAKCPAGVDTLFTVAVFVAGNYSATTGIKVELLVADNPLNATGGLNAVLSAELGPIVAGTSTSKVSGANSPFTGSTAVTATKTMPATVGVLDHVTISVTIANAGTPVAGTWHMLTFGRKGTNVSDTDTGEVQILGFTLIDY